MLERGTAASLFPRGSGGWPPVGGTVAPKASACVLLLRPREVASERSTAAAA
jgi:hypothetical protein